MKPALWAASLCVLVAVLVVSGTQAVQSRTVSGPVVVDSAITPTVTPTLTHTSTPTSTITSTPTPTPLEIVIEEPNINPAYGGGMCDTYWYRYTNDRGYYSYLTLNVNNPEHSTNSAVWRPNLTQPGYYRVEAFIPSHAPLLWDCPPNPRIIPYDTSDARYTILNANGQTYITGTQKSLNNGWLSLGEFLFRAGSEGIVSLSDLNDEASLSTTVSFSAVRFTWQRPPPILYYLPLTSKLASSVITSTVGIQNAPALDQCHLPTPAQMQTWWNSSPYRITNVYIGGGLLFHECSVPDRNWIEAVRSQGWGMIPTWVGPQAPCSGYRLRMSADPNEAFQQGLVEADAASQVSSQIGLAGSGGTGGTIIYYDMENYNPANAECRSAVKAFIAGWTERLHYWGNRSGAYGRACTSYVSDWAQMDAVFQPDNLWVAAWNATGYEPDVPLFGITCLPDPLWPNHQRIRQYAPGHNETYSGVTFNIDSNIADAEVVIPSHALADISSTTFISSSTPDISDFSSFHNTPDQGWLIADGVLYCNTTSNQGWQPTSDFASELAIRKAFFLDERQGWLIAELNRIGYQLFSTPDGGQTWHVVLTLPIEPGWLPQSLQFYDIQHGWIVVKQMTGSNFSVGRLLRTTDGGESWQTLDLPIGESVYFSSPDVGWVAGGISGNDFYQTLDGGFSWIPVALPLPEEDTITISLPNFNNPQNGILPVIIQKLDETRLEIFATQNGGETWEIVNIITKLPEGFASVKFSTPQVGWSATNVGTCSTANNSKACNLQTLLWRTEDGGETWSAVEFP